MLADAAFAADPKFLRLARNSPTPAAYAAAVGVFWLVLADARRARSPNVNWDDYEDYAEQITMLQGVRLLTKTGFQAVPFEKYAPVYQSPFDRERSKKSGSLPDHTPDYTEIHTSTQDDTHIGWTGLDSSKSPLPTEGGVGETNGLPSENDSATLACRMMFDGGKWLGDRDYVASWDNMDRRYTAGWVQEELPIAYDLCRKARQDGRVLPYDLRRMTELQCAERVRVEEKDRERLQSQRLVAEEAERRQKTTSMTDEDRERQALFRKATRIWTKSGMVGNVPEKIEELRSWVAANENPA
jgi:hypothetical protein